MRKLLKVVALFLRVKNAVRAPERIRGDQVNLLDDLFALHGNTVAGRGQALRLVPVNELWRRPVVEQHA